MRVILNEKSLIGIKQGQFTKLLKNYDEFGKVTEIVLGKEVFVITGRLAITEQDGRSRLHLTLEDYSKRTFKASVLPLSNGQESFLKFGNKEQTNPSLFLMQLLPNIHLLAEKEQEQIKQALERKLTSDELERKRLLNSYETWKVDQVTKHFRAASKLESFEEWYETVYQNVLQSLSIIENVHVKTSDLAEAVALAASGGVKSENPLELNLAEELGNA